MGDAIDYAKLARIKDLLEEILKKLEEMKGGVK